MSSLTAKQAQALRIVRKHGPVTPGVFARIMWPDSPSWTRVSNCGQNGARTGVGVEQAGGAFLSRLARKNLIRDHWDRDWRGRSIRRGYRLMPMGRGALKEYEQQKKEK